MISYSCSVCEEVLVWVEMKKMEHSRFYHPRNFLMIGISRVDVRKASPIVNDFGYKETAIR